MATPKFTPGTVALLKTGRANAIQPMVEIVGDDGKWIRWIGLFGGSKIRRSRRDRVARVLNDSHGIFSRGEQPLIARPVSVVDPGTGWRLLNEGEPLMKGDGFLHPDYGGQWVDYDCRPDLFRGCGSKGSWYHVPKNDTAHTWPWRRKLS